MKLDGITAFGPHSNASRILTRKDVDADIGRRSDPRSRNAFREAGRGFKFDKRRRSEIWQSAAKIADKTFAHRQLLNRENNFDE